jgi:hypothetical protein
MLAGFAVLGHSTEAMIRVPSSYAESVYAFLSVLPPGGGLFHDQYPSKTSASTYGYVSIMLVGCPGVSVSGRTCVDRASLFHLQAGTWMTHARHT